MQLKQLRELYLSTLKHADTEETIDLCFYRPVGFAVALAAARLHITPNAITWVGIVLGIGSGILLYPSEIMLNIAGLLLLVLADICDSADGQLARLTQQYSRFGRILDGVSSDIWFFSIYVCLAMRFMPQWGVTSWILAAAAGLSHALQASMADHYRQFHLFFVNGKSGSELDSSAEIKKQLAFTHKPMRKIALAAYWQYTALQEMLNQQMSNLRKVLNQEPEKLTPQLCSTMRQATLPLMKWTNALTFNWRAIALAISVFAQKPWLYLCAEVTIFNALLIYMLIRHELICKKIKKEIYI